MVQVRRARAKQRGPKRHQFTVEEYRRMAEMGVLHPEARVELIEGEVVDMPPMGSAHASAVLRLDRLFQHLVRDRAVVAAQTPLRLDPRSEPQPDLMLLTPRADFYAEALPTPRDVLLLVEVSDTTLQFDQGNKLRLYARHAIQEYWIVDVTAGAVHVYREPEGEGYRVTRALRRGERLSPAAFPDLGFPVDDVLG